MADQEHDNQENGPSEIMLPVVPEELDADPVLLGLLHCAAFLDYADDETVDPEAASEVLDHVAYYVRRLSAARLDELKAQLERVAEHGAREGWPEELVEFVKEFLENCTSDDEEDAETEAGADGN